MAMDSTWDVATGDVVEVDSTAPEDGGLAVVSRADYDAQKLYIVYYGWSKEHVVGFEQVRAHWRRANVENSFGVEVLPRVRRAPGGPEQTPVDAPSGRPAASRKARRGAGA